MPRLIFRLPLKEKMFFVQQLGVLLSAGIAITRALQTLTEQTQSSTLKHLLSALRVSVEKGEPLSQALKPFQGLLGSFFIHLIAAGEYTGKLEDTLQHLAVLLKKEYALKSKIRNALAYPLFIVALMIIVGLAMLILVLPKLIPLFEGLTAVPLPTRILLALSRFLTNYGLFVLLLVLLGSALLLLFRNKSRPLGDKIFFHLPVLRHLIKNIQLARVSRLLATLLLSDVPLLSALQISQEVIAHTSYRRALAQAAQSVEKGKTLSAALREYPRLFTPTILTMVSVGEESGTLGALLSEVANFYEETVDEAAQTLSTLLEPLLIVILGIGVGGLALAILLPMYALLQSV